MFHPGVPALDTAKHSPSCLAESRSRNLAERSARSDCWRGVERHFRPADLTAEDLAGEDRIAVGQREPERSASRGFRLLDLSLDDRAANGAERAGKPRRVRSDAEDARLSCVRGQGRIR